MTMCGEIPESARETMRMVNETLDAYDSGDLPKDEAGARLYGLIGWLFTGDE